jgi:hypothetical protein
MRSGGRARSEQGIIMRELMLGLVAVACIVARASAQSVLLEARGDGPGDFFGATVAGGGDLDGDRRPDLVVGALEPHPATLGKGYVRALSGRDGRRIFTAQGDALGDEFGRAIAMLGDVNGDGRADVCVGAPKNAFNGAGSGLARVLSSNGSVLYDFHGAAGDALGSSMSPVGDLDLDGRADFALGAPRGASTFGYVDIRSGATGAVVRHLVGFAPNSRFGAAVALAGDVNGDGKPDLIVGAPGLGLGSADPGHAYVFSGANGALLYTFVGPGAGSAFGASVDGAGDVNNDGYDDLIVGAWQFVGGFGAVTVYSGYDGIEIVHEYGVQADDFLGRVVAGAGDVDGDGYADYMFCGREDLDFIHPGVLHVRSGRTGELLMLIDGDNYEDSFAFGLARAGDVDGDGYDDVCAGAAESYHTNPGHGYARVFRGGPGWIVPYGPSCPGTAGVRPHMRLGAQAIAGAHALVSLRSGFPSSIAIVRFGRAPNTVFAAQGCATLIADPLPLAFTIPLDAAGAGERELALPLQPLLLPRLSLQAFVRDAGAPNGYSATSAIEAALY